MNIAAKLKYGIAATSLLVLAAAAAAGQAKAFCGCPDVNDMRNRIDEARAAIAEYQNQQKIYGNQPFDPKTYRDQIQPVVKKAIDKAHIPNTNSAGGGTNSADCKRNPNVLGDPTWMKLTPCLAEAIRIHEKVHGDACIVWTEREGSLRGGDYRSEMTIFQALNEEIFAYAAEIRFLKDQIKLLPANCRPAGYTGIINYRSEIKMATTEVVPPNPSAGRLGGRTVIENIDTRSVTVLVVADKAFVDQDITVTSNKDSDYTRMMQCGIKNPPYAHRFVGSTKVRMNVRDIDSALAFSVSPPDREGNYSISFKAPPATGGLSEMITTESTPPCGKAAQPTPPVRGPFQTNADFGYTIRGKADPNTEVLQGSTAEKISENWVITVSWEFVGQSNRNVADVLDELFPTVAAARIAAR